MSDVLQKNADNEYKPHGHLYPEAYAQLVRFKTYAPIDALVPFVEHFWTIAWNDLPDDRPSEQLLHRPYVDMFISESATGIQGTFSGKRTYMATAGNGRIIGCRFKPGAFHLFWDGRMADLQNTNIPIKSVFPRATPQFCTSILRSDDEDAVAKLTAILLDSAPEDSGQLACIQSIITQIEAFDNPQTVAEVAKLFGKSERWLQQLFQDYLGIGLKWLLQRNKLLQAAERIRTSESIDWPAMAYELGYSSQQHFITDFKNTIGKTPTMYQSKVHNDFFSAR